MRAKLLGIVWIEKKKKNRKTCGQVAARMPFGLPCAPIEKGR
jgi:hypothetical protein